MYSITLGKNKEAKLEVHLDGVPPLRVPAVVHAGIGNKKDRYTRYLERCFKDNSALLNTLAELHVHGYTHGSVTLICHPKVKAYHGVCIKEFLEKNDGMLKSLIPYIFPKMELPEELKSSEATQNLSDEEKAQFSSMMGGVTGTMENPPAQLTAADMAFFEAEIAKDQEAFRQTGKCESVSAASLEQIKPLLDGAPEEATKEVFQGYSPEVKEWTADPKQYKAIPVLSLAIVDTEQNKD